MNDKLSYKEKIRLKIHEYGDPGLDLSPPLDPEVAVFLEQYLDLLARR